MRPEGNPAGLRQTAIELHGIANALDRTASGVSSESQAATRVGETALAWGLSGRLGAIGSQLTNTVGELRAGADALNDLAWQLEELQRRAGPMLNDAYVAEATGDSAAASAAYAKLDGLDEEAAAARRDAANSLVASSRRTIRTTTYHPTPSVWSHLPGTFGSALVDTGKSVVGGVKDGVVGAVTGIGGLVGGTYDRTVRGIYDYDGFSEAWSGTGRTIEAVRENPGDAVLAVVDWETLSEDPARWAGALVPSIVGAKGLDKLAKSSKVGAAGTTLRVSDEASDLARAGRAADATGVTRLRVGGYLYEFDDVGPVAASGRLRVDPAARSGISAKVGHLGLPDDQGLHMVAARYGGVDDFINLVPGTKNVNLSQMKILENEWGRLLQNGDTVDLRVGLYSEGVPSLRPDGLQIEWTVNMTDRYEIFLWNE